jgi:hypothetical protein
MKRREERRRMSMKAVEKDLGERNVEDCPQEKKK